VPETKRVAREEGGKGCSTSPGRTARTRLESQAVSGGLCPSGAPAALSDRQGTVTLCVTTPIAPLALVIVRDTPKLPP
jgi:hypothetical protein